MLIIINRRENMKRFSKITASVLMLSMVFSMGSAKQIDAAKKAKVKSVKVESSVTGDSKNIVLAKGKSVKLKTTVTVTPDKAANKKVSYKSKNKKIATVNAKGVVKGVKPGKTKVVVTSKKNKKKTASINVKVVKGVVKKVTLSKTSGALNVGATMSLKATVKAAKGANKSITWTSSNAAVATVNAKGVVTAVGAGNATITAKATDGSGKKATCRLNVSDPINLVSAQVLNAQSISFSLNKACPLTPASVSVMKKVYQNGTYRNQLVIDSLYTTDNVNYTIVLNNDSRVYQNNYIQISVPSLSGTVKVLELIYSEPACAYTQETISTWNANEHGSDTLYFDNEYGYSNLTISNLPAGLTAESKNGNLYVKGTPTTPGVTLATLTGVDELGNTVTDTVRFVVSSDAVVVGAATTVYGVCSGSPVYNYKSITVKGGSGSYNYTVVSDPNGIVTNKNADGVIDYNNDESVDIKVSMPGDYAVVIRATDVKDATKFCDITIPVKMAQGISIGGSIVDAQGNKIRNASINFTNKDKGSLYSRYVYAYTDENGVYSATVAPGYYDISVNAGGDMGSTKYLYNQPLTVTRTGYDMQLPIYQVLFVDSVDPNTKETISASNLSWYCQGEYVGYGNSVYVKAGAHTFEATYTSYQTDENDVTYKIKYRVTATANIVNAGVQTAISREVVSKELYD